MKIKLHGLLVLGCLAGLTAGCGSGGVRHFEAGAAGTEITPVFEPYEDANQNRVWDAGETYEDLDGDGQIDTLWLGGFGNRQPTGVHDPLWARTVAFRLGGEIFTFTAVDALGISTGRIEAIKQAALDSLGEGCGLEPGRMVIASTHTHQAPDSIGIFGPATLEPGWDEDYLQLVVEGAALSISEAVADMRPAELLVASTIAGEELVRDTEPPDIIDSHVGILQAREPGGEAIVTMVSVANHPEAAWNENTEISSDYPHYLREELEAEFGGLAVYFSADLGLMQTPAETGEAGFERAELIGKAYAKKISAALGDATLLAGKGLQAGWATQSFAAPLDHLELRVAVEGNIAEGYFDYLYETEEGLCADSYGCFDLEVLVLEIAGQVTLVTIPGELTPELVLGGITRPAESTGPYPDAPAEPHLLEHIETPERFIIGLAGAEIGYIYPRMTYDPDSSYSYRHSPGPRVALPLMQGLIGALEKLP